MSWLSRGAGVHSRHMRRSVAGWYAVFPDDSWHLNEEGGTRRKKHHHPEWAMEGAEKCEISSWREGQQRVGGLTSSSVHGPLGGGGRQV